MPPAVAPTFGPEDVDPDPLVAFGRWFAEAQSAGEAEPEAMSLATATPDGAPSVRYVLLRGVESDAFVFYTNRTSRKGRELAANDRAALAWRWVLLGRQVRAEGRVEVARDDASDRYWAGRARGSQLGAWASRQSEVIDGRAPLEAAAAAAAARYVGTAVPRPPWWGGYRVVPSTVELWQGRPDRLHDRVRYRLVDRAWVRDRLSP